MNLASKQTVKNIFKKYGILPSRGLGQNFMIDKFAVKKAVLAAELSPEDAVLEIGPGIGTLTQELAKRVKMVLAVEKDPRMIEILRETLSNFKNVEIINKDVLESEVGKLFENLKLKIKKFKVVANLPFYLTAPLIRKFLELEEARPPEMVFIVQKEVAQRICARPPKMNLLAVSVQFYAQPKIISYVSKSSFWPKPKVDCAILRIAPLINADRKSINADLFFKVVKAGFSQPRKQLVNNLSKGLELNKKEVRRWLFKNDIKPEQRAEALTVEDWVNLAKSFNAQK